MTQAYKKQAIPPSRNGKSSRGMGVEYLTTLNVKERQTVSAVVIRCWTL